MSALVEAGRDDIDSRPTKREIPSPSRKSRKRKRNADSLGEAVEQQYWRQLAAEEARERQTIDTNKITNGSSSVKDPNHPLGLQENDKLYEAEAGSDPESQEALPPMNCVEVEELYEPPQHETISEISPSNDLEKSSRTVFLSNVSTSAITSKKSRKQLLDHLASFASKGSGQEPKIESLRFRSTAFADAALPRKAAFVKKSLMDSTTKATNAYVVFTSQSAARQACQSLNGTIVLDRHLRIDNVAHPEKQDHRKCVFVGNLPFVDDDSTNNASSQKSSKHRPATDVEEGLWREFGKVDRVENVRVIRDKVNRVSKGFAYVQFRVNFALS